MNDYTSRRIFYDTGMVIIGFLVGHRFLATFAARFVPGFIEFITVPLPFIIYHHVDISNTPPKDKFRWIFIKLNNHIRVFTEPPQIIPDIIKFQVRIIAPKLAGVPAGWKSE